MTRFRFTAHNGVPSVCGLTVTFSEEGSPVIILTELVDNPGMSVTNAIDDLSRAVLEHVIRDWGWDWLDGTKVIWLETYQLAGGQDQHYDLVQFDGCGLGKRRVTWSRVFITILSEATLRIEKEVPADERPGTVAW